MKILMVCLGNICRSPLAEGILQQKANDLKLGWVVHSAGTNGIHVGERPHHLSQKVAKLNGVDISAQIAQQFTKQHIAQYDKIYVMATDVMLDVKRIAGNEFNSNKIDYFLNELTANTNVDVPDPWYGEEDGYVEVFEIIHDTCHAIIKNNT